MKDDVKIRFKLDADSQYPFAGTGVMARVLKDDTAIGAIRFENRAEYEWFKQRVDGVFDIEQFELNKEGG